MEREKHFIIPPDLEQKMLIFRMTVPEFVLIVALFFLAVKQLTLGCAFFFALPSIAGVLFVRASDTGENVLYVLTKRFKYYLTPQSYNLRGDKDVD